MATKPYRRDYTGCNPNEVGNEKDAVIERLVKALTEIAAFTADVPDDHYLSHVHGTATAALEAQKSEVTLPDLETT